MKAIVISQPGGPEVLQVKEVEKPVPQAHQVLIKVTAAGINRPDTFQRMGKYPAPDGVVQDIPGLEVSGMVETTGAEVTKWQKGDRVMALIPGGGYAEYALAHEESCLPIPQNYSLEEAASLPEVLFTVWHNLFQRGRLQKGETVLIYGGSGGIGSMAIQLAALSGAKVWATAGDDSKAEYCKQLGAEKVIYYKDENLLETLGKESVDVVLDSLGGPYFSQNLSLLRPEGRLVYINAMEGVKSEINLIQMMKKRLSITGSTLRSRSDTFKGKLAQDILKNALPVIEDERFQKTLRYHFPLQEAANAHALMESRDFMGKIILKM